MRMPSTAELGPFLSANAPRLVCAALVAAIAGQLAAMIVGQYELAQPRVGPAGPLPAVPAPRRPQTGVLSVDRIRSAHLFGEPDTQVAAGGDESMPDDAPVTSAPLALEGTIATSDARGFAIIKELPAGAARRYAVGARLPGEAVLREIRRDRVLVERAGAIETLMFPRASDRRGALSAMAGQSSAGESLLPAVEYDASSEPASVQTRTVEEPAT